MRKIFTQKVFVAMLIAVYIFGLIPISKANMAQTQADEAVASLIEKEPLSRLQSNQKILSASKQDLDSKKSDTQSIKSSKESFNKSRLAVGTNNIVKQNYVPGEVLVKFRDQKINLRQFSGVEKVRLFAETKNLDKKEYIKKSNISVLKTKGGESVENAISRLKNDSEVEYVQPNFQYYPLSINTDDTYKNLLWGLDNTGQNRGTIDADIDAPEAWGISEGGENEVVVVAVIDTGVAYNHPDLKANMWDGSNCVDENGNALGGCNHGYDYEDDDLTPLPTRSSHGTHVAGTIGAVKNNNKGIIGVAPNVKIMALKSSLTTIDNINSINFAKHNGAKIINASWGGTFFFDDQALYDAINDFPGLFIAGAGNNTNNNDGDSHFYPSDYDLDNIISVAATNRNDKLASFSNYGAISVDVGAPGVGIYSTIAIASLTNSDVLNETLEEIVPPTIPDGWSKTGNWGTYNLGGAWGNVLYGDLDYPYLNNSDSAITLPNYNLSNAKSATINFLTMCDTSYHLYSEGTIFQDYMALEISADGNNYSELKRWNEFSIDIENGSGENPAGSAVIQYDLQIDSYYLTDNFTLRFRWVTDDVDNNYDGCLVDDIVVNKNKYEYSDGSDEQYEYMQGTSMAAPHVAGLAGLIWSYQPDMTYSKVKDIILTTGDDNSDLLGKTVSGKRINAFNALNSIYVVAPIITEVSPVPSPANNVTPNYTFHSDEAGTINYIGDCSSATVNAVVGGNTITFNVLSEGEHDNCVITVTDSDGNESNPLNITAFAIDTTAPVLGDLVYIKLDGESTNITPVNNEYVATIGSSEIGKFSNDLSNVAYINVNGADIATTFNVNWLEGDHVVGQLVYRATESDEQAIAAEWYFILDKNMAAPFTVGQNTFQVTFFDKAGNGTRAILNLITIDNTSPVITLLGGDMNIYQGTAYIEPGATATDNIDTSIHVNIGGDIINTSSPGTYVVTYNASDNLGNQAIETKRTVTVLAVAQNQIVINNEVNVDTNTAEVLIGYNAPASSTITVPSTATNTRLNVSALLSGADTKNANLQTNITIASATSIGNINVAIPACQISADSSWTGKINLPQIKENSNVTVTSDSGKTANVSSVIEIGFDEVKLNFGKAVRIELKDQAGKYIGYSRGGTFTQITQTCASDTQAAGDVLTADGDCKIDVNSDLVIWTKHFTKFITYTQTVQQSGGGGSSGGSSSGGGGSSRDATPPAQPKNFQAKRTKSQIAISWVNPTDYDFNEVALIKSLKSIDESMTLIQLKTKGKEIYKGKDKQYIDTEIEGNKNYYYALVASDINYNYTKPLIIEIKLEKNSQEAEIEDIADEDVKVLGVGITEREVQLMDIEKDAKDVYIGDIASTLANIGISKRNSNAESAGYKNYTVKLVGNITGLSPKNIYAITNFVVYGTKMTQILGEGERAGVVNSYKSAFGKLPATQDEWEDVIKIANGRWISQTSKATENKAKNEFKKIYKREANMNNSNDNAAVTIISYGLRPHSRNLNSERAASKIFKAIYKYNPKSAMDWDIVRAIAYSGAVR